MTFRAELKMKVASSSGPQFVDAWGRVAKGAAKWNGLISQSIAKPSGPDSEGEYVIVSEWEDEESFRQFEKDPAQDELTASLQELRVDSSMRLYEVIQQI